MSKTTSSGLCLQNGGTKRTTTHQTEPGRCQSNNSRQKRRLQIVRRSGLRFDRYFAALLRGSSFRRQESIVSVCIPDFNQAGINMFGLLPASHPFQESKRAFVIPSKVEPLLTLQFDRGRVCQPLETLQEIRQRVESSLKILRSDIKRTLNPTPYKVSVSDDLYQFLHALWLASAPIGELS